MGGKFSSNIIIKQTEAKTILLHEIFREFRDFLSDAKNKCLENNMTRKLSELLHK